MSSQSTACFLPSDQVVVVPFYNSNANGTQITLGNSYDVAIVSEGYEVLNGLGVPTQNINVQLFQNTNTIQVPWGYGLMLFFNNYTNPQIPPGLTFSPPLPSSGTFYGVVFNEPSSLVQPAPTYTFTVDGIYVVYNVNFSPNTYAGYGPNNFVLLTQQTVPASVALKLYAVDFPPNQQQQLVVNLANQSQICGQLMTGSPDSIFFSQGSGTGTTSTGSTGSSGTTTGTTTGSTGSTGSTSSSSNNILMILIAVIVAIIIGFVAWFIYKKRKKT